MTVALTMDGLKLIVELEYDCDRGWVGKVAQTEHGDPPSETTWPGARGADGRSDEAHWPKLRGITARGLRLESVLDSMQGAAQLVAHDVVQSA